MRWLFLLILIMPSTALAQSCFNQAGDKYQVSPELLRAIAKQESGMNATVVHRNQDGTWDYGVMQINDRWLAHLSQFGISKEGLMDPCQNIHVSAYIIRSLYNRYGENWSAIGHYNAAHPIKRAKYAWKIHKHLTKPGEQKESAGR